MNWISVKDKLPEFDTWVLVYSKDEHNGYNHIKNIEGKDYKIAYYYEVKFNEPYYTSWTCFGNVTHWMSLPEKPNEQYELNIMKLQLEVLKKECTSANNLAVKRLRIIQEYGNEQAIKEANELD